MSTQRKADILQLSVAERLDLVEAIWDSIAATPELLPLTEGQRAELDRRLGAYDEEPGAGAPWSSVRERIQRGK